jgi:hypothetical protein
MHRKPACSRQRASVSDLAPVHKNRSLQCIFVRPGGAPEPEVQERKQRLSKERARPKQGATLSQARESGLGPTR